MAIAYIQLPDCKNPLINGKQVDLAEVESLVISGPGKIPSGSFCDLKNLRELTITDDVTGIGKNTFHLTKIFFKVK